MKQRRLKRIVNGTARVAARALQVLFTVLEGRGKPVEPGPAPTPRREEYRP